MKVDHRQVRIMSALGKSSGEIAQRIGCSARHVRRIVSGRNGTIAKVCKPSQGASVSDREQWRFMKNAGMSTQDIADWFGVTRQAVSKGLKAGGE